VVRLKPLSQHRHHFIRWTSAFNVNTVDLHQPSAIMMKIVNAIILVVALIVASTEALTTAAVRKQISKLTKDNFSSTLTEIEPFLTKEAGASFYAKSMRRISVKANAVGATLPTDYAKEAKATEKRREKQKVFIEAKIAAAAEAEAAAAEAAAAEAAAAEAAAAEAAAAEATAAKGEVEAPTE
jgi:hypothetical protein